MFKKLLNFFSIKELYNDIHNNSYIISEKEQKYLKKVLVNMYCELKNGCDKYGIKLTLAGGSALGQVRHSGFIPWDDDLDTSLYREQYNKFIKIFDKEFGDRYILKAPNYHGGSVNRFAQVYKKGTIYKSWDSPKESPNMIYIDVFQIDDVPDGRIKRLIKGFCSNILMAIAGQVSFCEELTKDMKASLKRTFRGKLNLYSKIIIGKIFCYKKSKNWFDIIDVFTRCEKKGKLVVSSTGRHHYFGELFERDVFYPVKKCKFEGEEAYIYNDVKKYLIHSYGKDFMDLPPAEKRENHFIEKLSFSGEIYNCDNECVLKTK